MRNHAKRLAAMVCLPLLLLPAGRLLAEGTGGAPAGAPDPAAGWVLAAETNITQTQNAYSDNWSGEETGSISWAFNFNGLAERRLTKALASRSTLKLSFGQTHQQELDTRRWTQPAKSTDLIDLESVMRFTFGYFVDPFVAGRMQSQFLDTRGGSNRAVNPATITESAGFARTLLRREGESWIIRLGAGFRQTLDGNALLDSLSELRGRRNTNDGGLEFVSEINAPIVPEKIRLTSKLTLFQALTFSGANDLKGTVRENDWRVVDVNFENIFTAGITRYLMVNLYTQLLYDREVSKAGRFKETLSLGVTYTLL